MLKITNVTMRNFLSFGNVTTALKLNDHPLTLVLGYNTDVNGTMTRNGAGKSAVIQALCFALYGKPISKIKLPNLINNINSKNMFVSVEFEKNDIKYRIERGKKPDVTKFYINNKLVSDSKTSNEDDFAQGENSQTQDEINKTIGMTYNMFKNIIIMSTSSDPFLKMPVGQQRPIIEELLGVTQISQRADSLRKLISVTKEDFRSEETTIKATKEANSRIETTIENTKRLKQKWDKEHNEKIANLTEQIETLNSVDYDDELIKFNEYDSWIEQEKYLSDAITSLKKEQSIIEKEINFIEKEIHQFQGEIKSLKETERKHRDRLKVDIDRSTNNLNRSVESRKKIITELTEIENNISNSDSQECTCCGQPLTGTDHLKSIIDTLTKKRESKLLEQAEYDEVISEIENHIVTVQKELTESNSSIEEQIKSIEIKIQNKTIELEKPSTDLETKVLELETAMSNYKLLPKKPETLFNSRDELYKTKQLYDTLCKDLENALASINPYDEQVKSMQASLLEINYDKLNDLDNLLKHQEFLLKLLTSKDSFIRKKIIDQNLSYLNNRITTYLNKLGFPHEVKFMSDLSVEITLLGRDFDYEQLSRGEKNRVDMAIGWAFRDVWESLNDTVNIMFIDEMLDQGTDGQGTEAALAVLKSMARERGKNVLLISHRDELISRIDRILMVKKENGFTSLEYE